MDHDPKLEGSNTAAAGSGKEMVTKNVNCSCNTRARIRCQCRKTTVLSCPRCLINTGVEKMNYI